MTGPLAGRHILVVEDEYVIARQLVRALVHEGATVVGPAPGVAQAQALIADPAQTRIDAAILDVNLAGEQVYPVATLLAARGVPFLFASGYDVEKADPRFPAAPYLVKPLTMTRLVGTIVGLLATMSI